MEGSTDSDEGFVLPLSSDGDNSSVASINEGSESPSLSSWDSEPETDINCHEGVNLEENYLDIEEQNQFVGVENTDDGLLWEMDNRSYDDLLKKYFEKEEELRVSDFKLQSSEQEIIKLIAKVHNSEARCDNVREELKLKEEELNKLKEVSEEEFFKLKTQSEIQLNNVNAELKRKEEEMKTQQELIFNYRCYMQKSHNQVNNVNDELKLKQEELNKQKELSEEEIFKLKTQIEKTENRLFNVLEELKLKQEELNKQKELSEKEIFKLKTHIENSETQLDNVNEELKLNEAKLNKQKVLSGEEIIRLNIEILKSKNRLDNVQEALNLKVEKLQKQIAELVEQLEKKSSETHQLHGNLKVAQENMAKSELELVSNRKQIQMLGDSVSNHEEEVRKLKSELLDSQAKFSFDVASLSKVEIELTSKLEDSQFRKKELEKKLRRDREAKIEKEKLHARTQIVFKEEINCLREELGQKMHLVEAANKEREMVVIERDEANAKVDKLEAEICSCNDTLKLHATQQMVLKEEINCLRDELVQKMHLVEAADKEREMVVIERDEANAKIYKLEAEICSCNDKFKLHATQQMVLQDEINCLRKELGQKMNLVEAANKERGMVVIERDEANAKIDKLEAEICSCNDKFKLHATQQMALKEEINCLRKELGQKMNLVAAANKEREMVVTERDEANVKIYKLKDEICSCNDTLSNTRGYVRELEESLTEIVVHNKTIRNEGKMLKLRVEELEEELTRQNSVISDKDEEKREAIRQLCYSLEHYKSGYRELVQEINTVLRERYGHQPRSRVIVS